MTDAERSDLRDFIEKGRQICRTLKKTPDDFSANGISDSAGELEKILDHLDGILTTVKE